MPIRDWTQAQVVAEQIRSLPQDECESLWEALLHWLRKEFPPILGRLLPDRDLREDALQEALLNVYQGLHTYDPQRSFKTWAEHVAIHAAYRVQRRRGRILAREIPEPAEDAFSDDEPRSLEDCYADPEDYESLVIRRERAHYLLECARAELSKDELLVFEAIVSKETSYDELATLLKKRSDALRQQFTRAREKVLARAVLHPHLFTNEEIQEGVNACQNSSNPLTERELAAVQETLCGNPHRKPPSHRNTQHFRNACAKLAPYLLRYLVSLILLVFYCALTSWTNSVTNSAQASYSLVENYPRSGGQPSRRS